MREGTFESKVPSRSHPKTCSGWRNLIKNSNVPVKLEKVNCLGILFLPGIAFKEQGHSARAGMAADGGAHAVDEHLAI